MGLFFSPRCGEGPLSKDSCLFLGTGASLGIPMIGCHCAVCLSKNPKDKRLRCSALLTIGGRRILIDTSPDFRQQALTHQIEAIDAIVWTHAHQDHVGGMDDLRPLFMKRKEAIPCYLSASTFNDIKFRFGYIVNPDVNSPSLRARLDFNILPSEGKVDVLGLELEVFTYLQLGMEVTGLRFGTFAYVVDIKNVEPLLYEKLKGVETLVISALRYEISPLHLTLAEANNFGLAIGAKNTYLTHIAHEIGAEEGQKRLSPSVELAYDGLEINL